MAILLFIGCNGEQHGGGLVVRMWISPQMNDLADFEHYSRLSKQFMRQNPGISVKVEVIPWSRRTDKMITAFDGDRAPDAAYIGPDVVPQFIHRAMIRPVDDLLTEKEKADYDRGALEAATADGKLWLYPMDRSLVAAIYNKDLFKAAGLDPEKPPRTWEDLDEVAHKLTRDTDGDGRIDQWGLAYILGGDTLNMTFWPLLWQAGGDVLSPDSRHVAFAGPEGLEALQFITKLFRDGCIPQSYLNFGSNEFAAGKVGYWWGVAPIQFVQLRRDAPSLRLGVAPVLERRKRMSYSTIGSFCIFSSSKHPVETAKWLSFITQPENMRDFCKAIYRLPTKKSVGGLYGDDPDLAEFERQEPFCRTDVKSIYARQIMGALVPEIQAAVLGRKTPEQALKDASVAANRLLGRGAE